MKACIVAAFLSMMLPASAAWAYEAGSAVVDPGHGGYENGISNQGLKEKEVVLDVAKEIERIFTGIYGKADLTRKIDSFTPIRDRHAVVNDIKPDMFISVHCSATDSFAVYVNIFEDVDAGMTLKKYYSLPMAQKKYIYESGKLADSLASILKSTYDSRVYRREVSLPVLARSGAPSVLVEMPLSILQDQDYDLEVMRIASALAIGMLHYQNFKMSPQP